MQLRDYQRKSIDLLYNWIANNEGNPCVVLPTGAGKSVVIATLVKESVQKWRETRVLMLVSSKELIAQNAAKMRSVWANAPMGIYSASLNRRDIGEQITFAGIQSVRNKSALLGHIDLCIVDECDMISHKDEGAYRTLINDLLLINPYMRVIGFTATPFRLGHGLITDKPAIFDALIEPTSIQELINQGYLSPLRSKMTRQRLSTEGVKKRGGEYIESELQKAVDTDDINNHVVDEVIRLAEGYKHWLFFCSGVEHAEHVAKVLSERGITSASLTGETNGRDQILADFASGKIKALTNANILTVGYDFPDLDCIVMLRPTMSPRLYMQVAGRGTRIKSHIDHCLFLDFAGVIHEHGAITEVRTPKKGSSGEGEAPIKSCDVCFELVHPSVMICPCCGTEFPKPEAKPLELHNDCIMGGGTELVVKSWFWQKHTGKTSNVDMLKLTYYGDLSDTPITEYLTIMHDNYAGTKARTLLATIARNAQVELNYNEADLIDIAQIMNNGKHPNLIEYKKNGKFYNVVNREWI